MIDHTSHLSYPGSYNMPARPNAADRNNVISNLTQAAQQPAPSTTPPMALAYAPDAAAQAQATAISSQEKDSFGFADILDMINPLQHVPVMNIAYRHITGDEIKPVAQVIGDTIFGGALGGVLSLANVIVKDQTGSDIPTTALSFFGLGKKDAPLNSTITVAENDVQTLQAFDNDPDALAAQLNAIEPGAQDLSTLPGTVIALANLKQDVPQNPAPRKSAFVSFELNS